MPSRQLLFRDATTVPISPQRHFFQAGIDKVKSPRITEQDAREILNAYWASNADDDDWGTADEGRAILEKLNNNK